VKKKSIIIIAVTIIVAIFAVISGNHYSTLKEDEADFSVSDTASITKFFLADKGVYQSLLERTDKGWILNKKYPANQKVVEYFLETLRKIRVKSPVSHAAYNNVVKRMAGFGVKVEIYQRVPRINLFNRIKLFYHEKLTKVFYVGDATQNNLGTYMLMEGSKQPYIVYIPGFRGFVSVRFTPKPVDWRSHVVFNNKLATIKSVTLINEKEPEQSFTVSVVDALGNYKLKRISDNKEISNYDTLKILNLLTSFNDIKFEALLNDEFSTMEIDSITSVKPIYILTLVTTDNDTNTVYLYEKPRFPDEVNKAINQLVPVDLDRMYGLINKKKDFVLVQYYVFDKLLNPLDYYIKKD
jgi:hypothetical protein